MYLIHLGDCVSCRADILLYSNITSKQVVADRINRASPSGSCCAGDLLEALRDRDYRLKAKKLPPLPNRLLYDYIEI